MLWAITEAPGKYTTRYQSLTARNAPKGTKLQHEHVIPRKQLVAAIMLHPERAREIARTAIGCVVTKQEHDHLTRITRKSTRTSQVGTVTRLPASPSSTPRSSNARNGALRFSNRCRVSPTMPNQLVALGDILGFKNTILRTPLQTVVHHYLGFFRRALQHAMEAKGWPGPPADFAALRRQSSLGIEWFSDTIIIYTKEDTDIAVTNLVRVVNWLLFDYGELHIDTNAGQLVGRARAGDRHRDLMAEPPSGWLDAFARSPTR